MTDSNEINARLSEIRAAATALPTGGDLDKLSFVRYYAGGYEPIGGAGPFYNAESVVDSADVCGVV